MTGESLNLRRAVFLLEWGIRSFPEGSEEADRLAEAVNLILDVLGNSPDESPVSAGPDRPDDSDDRFGQLIRAAADRSADSILDSLSARRRREATPLERFRQRYANGF